MRYRTFIPFMLTLVLSGMAFSCERDPQFVKGEYRYENHKLNYLSEFLIQWESDDLSEDIKETVWEIVNSLCFVQGGSFTMGADNVSFPDEKPTHKVSLSDFYLSKMAITQKQWTAIMGENPLWSEEYGKGDDYPANFISYKQAQQFISLLNKYSGLKFRMPTEAEWEYAACGGKHSHGYLFCGSNNADEVAWHNGNSNGRMHVIGTLSPNELGVYNMSGNVWEWCSDWYGSYTSNSADNPTGPSAGTKRVVRGGSFTYEAKYCRCKTRNCLPEANQSVSVGLRLAISANKSE